MSVQSPFLLKTVVLAAIVTYLGLTTPVDALEEPDLLYISLENAWLHSSTKVMEAVGMLEKGEVKVGDEVEIVGFGKVIKTTVFEILTAAQGHVDRAVAVKYVELLMRGAECDEIRGGMIIATPGSVNKDGEMIEKVSIPLLLPVEKSYFALSIVASEGEILRGAVKVGDEVEIVGFGGVKRTTVTFIEISRIPAEQAVAGDNVQLSLGGVGKIRPGTIIATPGSVSKYNEMESKALSTQALVESGALYFPVEDVISIAGRGTVATGRIERGAVNTGDEVEILGFGKVLNATVTGVEMFRKVIDQAVAGDNVGLLLKGVNVEDIVRGMIIATPGSFSMYDEMIAKIHILTTQEGGSDIPLATKELQCQIYLKARSHTITLKLGPRDEKNSFYIGINLPSKMVLEVGQTFAIRIKDKTISYGIVIGL